MMRRMTRDPAGFYERLEVDPAAAPREIVAAFRRKARILHPDVPNTGDVEAFVRMKEAYEVLGNARRRAAYDRAARAMPGRWAKNWRIRWWASNWPARRC